MEGFDGSRIRFNQPISESIIGQRLSADNRLARLESLVESNASLAGCLTQTATQNAAEIYRNLPVILKRRPELVGALNRYQRPYDEGVVLVVEPSMPLVLAAQGSLRTVLVPVLGCTINAILDLREYFSIETGHHEVVYSENLLEALVWEMAIKGAQVMKYDNKRMEPQDYIALATTTFSNEVFRRSLKSLGY